MPHLVAGVVDDHHQGCPDVDAVPSPRSELPGNADGTSSTLAGRLVLPKSPTWPPGAPATYSAMRQPRQMTEAKGST